MTHFSQHFSSDLDPAKLPSVTPFKCTDVDSNEYKFIASTKPIFQNLPNHGNFSVCGMLLDDLKSSSKHFLNFIPSPTNHHTQNRQLCLVLAT